MPCHIILPLHFTRKRASAIQPVLHLDLTLSKNFEGQGFVWKHVFINNILSSLRLGLQCECNAVHAGQRRWLLASGPIYKACPTSVLLNFQHRGKNT